MTFYRASLIDLYLHTEFHSNRKNFLWTDGRTSRPTLSGRSLEWVDQIIPITVLSSQESHCESLLGSRDECRSAHKQPPISANWLEPHVLCVILSRSGKPAYHSMHSKRGKAQIPLLRFCCGFVVEQVVGLQQTHNKSK